MQANRTSDRRNTKLVSSATRSLISLIGAAFVCVPAMAAASPLVAYDFNEPTGPALSQGSIANAPSLTFFNNSGAQVDSLRGPASSGPSGLASDRAFDNSASTGIFASRASHTADFDGIDGLPGLTLSGWFFVPAGNESIGRQAGLFENSSISALDAPAGFRLRGGAVSGSSTLELRINRDSAVESDAAYTEVGQWVNFAATFSAGQVSFYKGSITSPVALVSSHAIGETSISNDAIPLTIGASPTSGLSFNPFAGLLDNFRIYDSALALADLEAARSSDVSVPEPTSLGLLALAGVAAGRRRAR